MKSLKSVIAGAAALAILGGGALAAAGSASAATPGFEPDANVQGSVAFYDASGNQVTSGTDLNHLFDYAVASTAASRPTTKATLFFGFPDHTKADSSTWAAASGSASTNYPNAAAPAPLNAVTTPMVTLGPTDGNLAGPLGSATLDTTGGYVNIIQVRVKDSGAGVGNGILAKPFWATDIQIDQGAGTWTQVYPAPPAVVGTSISAITAAPVTPAPAGTTSVALSATLSATDSTHPGGSVHLFNGATDLGAATLNAGTGAISATATVADSTAYSFQFKYTPVSGYSASSSAALAYTVNGAAKATTTLLNGPTTATVGSPVTIHADVKTTDATPVAVPAGAGTVQFKIGGTNSGSPVTVSAGGADFSYTPSAAGSATITATFTPTGNYLTSSDTTGVTVVATAPTYPSDPQTVDVNIPAGTLVISTPYTVANPFHLGNMTLDASGSYYYSTAPFGAPQATAVAATDPGNLGNTALNHVVYDAATNSTTTLTAATNAFSGTDVGKTITGAGIPSGTTIASVTDATTAVLSAAATASGTGVTVTVGTTYPAAKTNNGVTITDTRAGSTGWTASVQTTDFTNTGSTPIPGDLLSFTSVTPKYLAGNAIQSGVNPHELGTAPSAVSPGTPGGFKTIKKAFADTTHGPGTVNITGVLGLTAATSTTPGLYTATVTFTIA